MFGVFGSLSAALVTMYVGRLIADKFNLFEIGGYVNEKVNEYVEGHDDEIDELLNRIEMKRVPVQVEERTEDNNNEYEIKL